MNAVRASIGSVGHQCGQAKLNVMWHHVLLKLDKVGLFKYIAITMKI